MLEWKRGGLTQEILDKHDVISGGTNDTPRTYRLYNPKDTYIDDWEDDEWYCVLPEIAVPKPTANRFGLKVGDTVTIKPHDAKDGCVSTSHVIAAIEDTYRDGIARFRLDDTRSSCWHPYYFGLCQSDGSPLPEKPATKTILLEEWCCIGNHGTSFTFVWHTVGRLSTPVFVKTGKTRELGVPNE